MTARPPQDSSTLTRQQIQGNRPRATTAPRRKKVSRRRIWARRIGVLGIVGVLILVGAGVYLWYFFANPRYVNVNGEQSEQHGQVNILMIGSTTRCGLKHQNPAYGLCEEGVTGVNSDIVMILHLNQTTGKVSLLSIPRDLFVPNARPNGQFGQSSPNKIDAALVDGPSQLVAAIEEDFGIRINHLVELNFDTFASVVDTLGGINMYFPDPLYDAESGLNIKKTGCIHLDGYEALQVVRARHLQYQPKGQPHNFVHQTWPQEALSDIARIQRTHEFLRILATEVAKKHDIFNVGQDLSLANDIVPNLTVDAGWSKFSMASLAEQFAGTHITDVPQFTYPIVTVDVNPQYIYQGGEYGDVEFPVQPGGYEAVNSIFNVAPGANSFTGKPLPSPSSVKLVVDNGTYNTAQASVIAAQLRGRGFDVSGTGSTTPNDPTENETVVWYGGPKPPNHGDWKSPDLAAAEAVEEQLSGPVIMGWDPAMVSGGNEVRLVLGNDVAVLPKGRLLTATTTTTSTTSTTTTTTTTAPGGAKVTTTTVTPTTVYDPPGIKNDGSLGAPTQLASKLTWYDPYSCNAAGTGPGSY